jgi:hypothetical protein
MKSPEHILFIFVDGLGIGSNDPSANPCCNSPHFFNHFDDEQFPKPIEPNGYVLGLDASLGMPGLPQSATGQTALLTGLNASKLLGRHLNRFPNQQLRDVIAEHSIFKWFVDRGYNAAFLNTFSPPFFDYDPYDIIKHLSVTTVATLVSGLSFFDTEDLRNEKSVYQDIIGDALRERVPDAPQFTPEKAGEIIGKQSQQYHFSLFEYFQTDKAGHSQDLDHARTILNRLEEFLDAVLKQADLDNTLILLTSDHGNIEDLSFRGHTKNPAMTLLFGTGAEKTANQLFSILDIYPTITAFFE